MQPSSNTVSADFEKWWLANSNTSEVITRHDLAKQAWEAALSSAARKRIKLPEKITPKGKSGLNQIYIAGIEKGWKEGISAFRKMIKGETE